MQEILFTVAETSKILKVNKNFVYKLINARQLIPIKLGRIKISIYEIERFVKEAKGKDYSDVDNVVDFKLKDEKESESFE